jgi:hypothetical protein
MRIASWQSAKCPVNVLVRAARSTKVNLTGYGWAEQARDGRTPNDRHWWAARMAEPEVLWTAMPHRRGRRTLRGQFVRFGACVMVKSRW